VPGRLAGTVMRVGVSVKVDRFPRRALVVLVVGLGAWLASMMLLPAAPSTPPPAAAAAAVEGVR